MSDLPLAALDTETTGPDFWHNCRPFFVSTCDDNGKVKCWEWPVCPMSRIPKIPRDQLAQVQKFVDTHRIIFHNTKFDVRALQSIGIKWTDEHWARVEDTIVLSHLYHSIPPHGLKPLSEQYLDVSTDDQKALSDAVTAARRRGKQLALNIAREGHPMFPGIKFSGRTKPWAMDMWLPREVARIDKLPKNHPWWTVLHTYAQTDAERTMALYHVFAPIIEKRGDWPLYEVRKRMLQPLYDMEERGITYHQGYLEKTRKEYTEAVTTKTQVCKNIVHREGGKIDNLGSFPQLQGALFGTLKVPVTVATKTGYSTKKEELLKVQAKCSRKSKGYSFIKNLLEVTQRTTAITYLNGYERFSVPYEHGLSMWEVLHPSFNLTGTRTTRQSSEKPNAQNISKKEGFNLRSVFGPAPGRVWFAMDYANIELRILAWEANETELMDAFRRGESIHMRFARIVCPEKIRLAGGDEAFKKTDQYRWVKNGDFALTYGASETTADATYHIPGAYAKVRGYFTNLDTYMSAMVSDARRNGYVPTRIAVGEGYPLYVDRKKAYTQAVDYVCQGTAGYAMTVAVVEIYEYLKRYPDHHMIITIHDELVFDFPADHPDNEEVINFCAHLMAGAGTHIDVPLQVECDIIETTWDKGIPYALSL